MKKKHIILLGLIAILDLFSSKSHAMIITVTSRDDLPLADAACPSIDRCTLRKAIQQANTTPGPDTINLSSGEYSVISGSFNVTESVSIYGTPGIAPSVTIRGNRRDRLFFISSTNVSINNISIVDGQVSTSGSFIASSSGISSAEYITEAYRALAGGGLLVEQGASLVMNNSVVMSNAASLGGGIANRGTLTLNNVALAWNQATHDSGGGLLNVNTATLNNVTIDNNTATTSGGGIQNCESIYLEPDFSCSSVLRLNNATLYNNRVSNPRGEGGGLYNESVGSGSAVVLNGVTILANEAASGSGIKNARPTSIELKNVIISRNTCVGAGMSITRRTLSDDASCNSIFTSGPYTNVPDMRLGDFGPSEGSHLWTAPLLVGSPAIDAGLDCPTNDALNHVRNDGNADARVACDVGAVEYIPPVAPPPPPPPAPDDFSVACVGGRDAAGNCLRSVEEAQIGSAQYVDVLISASPTFNENVVVEWGTLPTGITASIESGDESRLPGTGPRHLSFVVGSSAVSGVYDLPIRARGVTRATILHSTNIRLTINRTPPARIPDPTLTPYYTVTLNDVASGNVMTLFRGGSQTVSGAVNRYDGYTDDVVLSASVPGVTGVRISFSQIPSGGPFVMQVSVDPSVPEGSYQFVITADSHSIPMNFQGTLTVLPALPVSPPLGPTAGASGGEGGRAGGGTAGVSGSPGRPGDTTFYGGWGSAGASGSGGVSGTPGSGVAGVSGHPGGSAGIAGSPSVPVGPVGPTGPVTTPAGSSSSGGVGGGAGSGGSGGSNTSISGDPSAGEGGGCSCYLEED